MSIQWTIIATFLYFEIGFVFILTLPIISPQRWSKLFKSRFLHALGAQAYIYFYILLGILILFFMDAIREMRKYSSEGEEQHTHSHLDAEMQTHMKLFRSQRNFYISGFSLFLSLVIRRLMILLSNQASLMAQSEASLKQAESATQAAKLMMKESEQLKSGESVQNRANEAHDKEVKDLKEQLHDSEEEINRLKKNLASIKTQAENVTKEYDRLLEEHEKLQKALEKAQGVESVKKDE